MDNVVTSSLVFTGNGKVEEYVGGFSDWQSLRKSIPTTKGEKPAADKTAPKPKQRDRKLSYKEKQELEALPLEIEQLEEEHDQIMTTLSDPEFFKKPADEIQVQQNRLKEIESRLPSKYERWQILEEIEA